MFKMTVVGRIYADREVEVKPDDVIGRIVPPAILRFVDDITGQTSSYDSSTREFLGSHNWSGVTRNAYVIDFKVDDGADGGNV